MLQYALDLSAFDYPYCAGAELLIVKFIGSEWIVAHLSVTPRSIPAFSPWQQDPPLHICLREYDMMHSSVCH